MFGVDTAVIPAALWQLGQRCITQNCSPLLDQSGHQEAAFFSDSPTGGNLALLKTIPVRVYCEPDVAFWRQHYCPTLQVEDLNAAHLQLLVSCLRRQGNQRAHYLVTRGNGRLGRRPFPHSWSIVDAPECIRWLQTAGLKE